MDEDGVHFDMGDGTRPLEDEEYRPYPDRGDVEGPNDDWHGMYYVIPCRECYFICLIFQVCSFLFILYIFVYGYCRCGC